MTILTTTGQFACDFVDKKLCPKCDQTKPLTPEFWLPRKGSRDGYRGVCRLCWYAQQRPNKRRHYARNRVRICAERQQDRRRNPERRQMADLRYHLKHRERRLEYNRRYYWQNHERLLAYKRWYNRHVRRLRRRRHTDRHCRRLATCCSAVAAGVHGGSRAGSGGEN